MMVAGIVSLSAGGVAFFVGAALVAEANDQVCFDGNCKDEDLEIAGIVTMVGGGALIALGIPLLIVGARKVPIEGAEREEASKPWVPEVSLGPTSATARWAL